MQCTKSSQVFSYLLNKNVNELKKVWFIIINDNIKKSTFGFAPRRKKREKGEEKTEEKGLNICNQTMLAPHRQLQQITRTT